MCRPAQYGLRFLVVIAIVSLLPMLFTSPGPARGPYVSALSNLAVPQTLAASICNDKACIGGSRFNLSCGRLVGFNCAKFGRDLCSDGPCS